MTTSKALCALAAVPLVLAACAMNPKSRPISAAQKEAQAERKLCGKMDEKQALIREYPMISADTPLESVMEANRQVENAVEQVRESSQEVSNPRVLDVQEAYRELQNSVNEVPGGRSTVGESADTVRAGAERLREAWNQLYMDMQCGA